MRIAVIGCGRIVRLAHLRALLDNARAEVIAIADTEAGSRAYAATHAPSAAFFDRFEDLLNVARPDAVLVALPTQMHRDATLAALAAGAHVYLEKPIASTLADAASIVTAWSQSGLIGRIGFNLRFSRLSREMKSRIARGDIGQPLAARTAWTARFPERGAWRLSPVHGGGALLELGSHHVDMLRFLFDSEISSVAADVWSNRGDDEAAVLSLTLSNGLHAQSFFSYGSVEEDRVEIYGTEGKLTVNRYDSLIVERTGPNAVGGLSAARSRFVEELKSIRHGVARRRAPGREPSFAASINAFIDSVTMASQSTPDLNDGLRAIEVVEAARRAARERRIATLST